MRFTIRDLLWLTVVVALGLGWFLREVQMSWELHSARSVSSALAEQLDLHRTLVRVLQKRADQPKDSADSPKLPSD